MAKLSSVDERLVCSHLSCVRTSCKALDIRFLDPVMTASERTRYEVLDIRDVNSYHTPAPHVEDEGIVWFLNKRNGGVPLSGITSATLVPCCIFTGDCRGNPEEGGDDVKSAWPLRLGLHTWYNGRYKGLPSRKTEPILKNRSQFGSEAATRLREVGIASNRGSARHGEYVLGSCTHRPSHHGSW